MKTLDNFSTQKIEKQNLATTKGGCTTEELIWMVWNASPAGVTHWTRTGESYCGQTEWWGWNNDYLAGTVYC